MTIPLDKSSVISTKEVSSGLFKLSSIGLFAFQLIMNLKIKFYLKNPNKKNICNFTFILSQSRHKI